MHTIFGQRTKGEGQEGKKKGRTRLPTRDSSGKGRLGTGALACHQSRQNQKKLVSALAGPWMRDRWGPWRTKKKKKKTKPKKRGFPHRGSVIGENTNPRKLSRQESSVHRPNSNKRRETKQRRREKKRDAKTNRVFCNPPQR